MEFVSLAWSSFLLGKRVWYLATSAVETERIPPPRCPSLHKAIRQSTVSHAGSGRSGRGLRGRTGVVPGRPARMARPSTRKPRGRPARDGRRASPRRNLDISTSDLKPTLFTDEREIAAEFHKEMPKVADRCRSPSEWESGRFKNSTRWMSLKAAANARLRTTSIRAETSSKSYAIDLAEELDGARWITSRPEVWAGDCLSFLMGFPFLTILLLAGTLPLHCALSKEYRSEAKKLSGVLPSALSGQLTPGVV
jgi:hypothetical protein